MPTIPLSLSPLFSTITSKVSRAALLEDCHPHSRRNEKDAFLLDVNCDLAAGCSNGSAGVSPDYHNHEHRLITSTVAEARHCRALLSSRLLKYGYCTVLYSIVATAPNPFDMVSGVALATTTPSSLIMLGYLSLHRKTRRWQKHFTPFFPHRRTQSRTAIVTHVLDVIPSL